MKILYITTIWTDKVNLSSLIKSTNSSWPYLKHEEHVQLYTLRSESWKWNLFVLFLLDFDESYFFVFNFHNL